MPYHEQASLYIVSTFEIASGLFAYRAKKKARDRGGGVEGRGKWGTPPPGRGISGFCHTISPFVIRPFPMIRHSHWFPLIRNDPFLKGR